MVFVIIGLFFSSPVGLIHCFLHGFGNLIGIHNDQPIFISNASEEIAIMCRHAKVSMLAEIAFVLVLIVASQVQVSKGCEGC